MFHSKLDVDRHVNNVFRNIKSEYERNSKCYQIAKLYYKFRDYKSAIKYINRYILTTTNSAAAYRLLGECYLGVNLKVKAIDSFKTSIELNGSQNDLVLKICTLLMDLDVSAVTPRTTYWLERAETLFPKNPVVFQLREHFLKSVSDGKQDNEQFEKLILSEIKARPADVTVRIRLLNFFIETKRYKIAYHHALEIEERNIFSNDLRWYDCLCNVVQAYEKANNGFGFSFYIKKIMFCEKRADLFMQEFQEEVKTLPECSAALFAFDQSLHSISKIEVPPQETYFYVEFMKHMRAQLSFHLATLALKRAKKEYGIWPKAFRTASPLLLQATENTMDLDEAWYNVWEGKNKMENEVKQLNKTAAFRISQAGHILLAWSQSKGSKFLEKVSQSCGGKWQSHIYQDVFYNREHQQAIATSHFLNDPFFANVPMRLLTDTELNHFDEVSQSAYPDSLHHMVWLGIAYCSNNGYLSHDFRCTIVPDLQFTATNLSQTGPETLNQLDVDAFLYASVLCAKSAIPNNVSTDRPNRLPVSISEGLCSPAQSDWWSAVYKTYTNQASGNIADMRLKLRKGIEVIRVFGLHGLHVKIIVMLAKLFQERATNNKNPNELSGLEDRAYLYWTAAIPLLEKIEKNQVLREVPNSLFDYRGKSLTLNEIKGHLEDGRLFLACRLMKQGKHEQAVEAFQSLKSPYASFYQALIYEKLASEEVNHRPESITSENRSQHIILLTRARDALYLTLDRLRSPSTDPNHPLNAQLHDHLDQIEKHLAGIELDSNMNRNGDSQSDETDTLPGRLSPDVDENLESSFNAFNTNNLMGIKNHSMLRTLRQNLTDKHHNIRFEARPSPERLDAQLRHLVQANSNGLHAIVEQLKEMKSTMQIELKDLGCVTRDLLAEMKRWNDKLESMSKRSTDVIKPEDLFELKEEDYEDICQLPQSYPQNYQLNRQMTGSQGTSTVTYGTSVPSPGPPVPPVMQTSENPLIPPAFYPGSHPVPAIDPSLLLYQSVGYYPTEMQYSENQNMIDYRGAAIQKGVPFTKTSFKVPDTMPSATLVNNKSRPPNVVITSSDTLPAFTSAGTPAMSVTVPPQHIRGLVPSSTIAQKPSPSHVHPFQIQMPPQAQLVKESPTEKLNSLIPTATLPVNTTQTPLVFGINSVSAQQAAQQATQQAIQLATQQTIQQTQQVTQLKEAEQADSSFQSNKNEKKLFLEQQLEGSKLFESHATLFIFDKKWEEKGIVLVKILDEKKLGKVKVFIVDEASFTIHVNHYIESDMEIEPLTNGEYGWSWTGSNIHHLSTIKPSELVKKNLQKFSLEFNTLDESRDFEFAFNEGRRISKEKNVTELPKLPSQVSKSKECVKCKLPLDGTSEKCSACESKEKSSDTTKFGGFTFTSSPILKPPTQKVQEPTEKVKEQQKPSPFLNFSLSAPAVPSKTDSLTETTPSKASISWFAEVKTDPNAFKKDANFKDFEGKDSHVFSYLNKPGTQGSVPRKATTPNTSKNEEEFEPTVEFKPVVDLPDLVDVKTGEENDKVLYEERAKLLRFDKEQKSWKERGTGQMKVLLNEETGKVRLIMRRELVLKVCCNHYLDEKMEFQRLRKSDKAVTWCAQDYSEGQITTELFALKFSNPDSMVRFETAIKNAQIKMKNCKIQDPKAKETSGEKSQDLRPLSELFKPKTGSWECDSCLVRNTEDATKCVSCTASKPGTQSVTEAPSLQSTGLGKGITFPSNAGKFVFGIPQSTETNSASTTTATFNLGIPQTAPSSTTFKLGLDSITNTQPVTAVSSSVAKFKDPSQTTPVTFDFSANKTAFANTGTSVGATSDTIIPVSTSGSVFTLSTTFNTIPSTASLSNFNFSIANSSTSMNEAPNIFGNKSQNNSTFKTEENKVLPKSAFPFTGLKPERKEKFEFSMSNIKPINAETAISKSKSLSPKKKGEGNGDESEESEEADEEKDDNGDHIVVKPVISLPDKVPLHTGEEDEDVCYENRAKLFRFVNKEWKERGIGNIKILRHKTNNKIRLLMRRETILKICLNHYLTPDIVFQRKDNKAWTWAAADFSEGEVQYTTFAVRFKTPEFAQEFKRALEDAQNKVLSSPPKLDSTGKSKEASAAMKNFTFSLLNPPKSEPSMSSQSGALDNDVLIVYENKVTPEQRDKAMSLHLPPKFYAYLQAPSCSGCLGCDKDDASVENQQNLSLDSTNKSIFQTKSWGSLNFGKDDKLENKFLFTFAGNQGDSKWNPISLAPKITQDADNEEEEEEEEEAEDENENDDGSEDRDDDDDDDVQNVDDDDDVQNVDDDDDDHNVDDDDDYDEENEDNADETDVEDKVLGQGGLLEK